MVVGECQNCKNLFHLSEAKTETHEDNITAIYICPKCKHGNYEDKRNFFTIYKEV